jgi:hypothetical protein
VLVRVTVAINFDVLMLDFCREEPQTSKTLLTPPGFNLTVVAVDALLTTSGAGTEDNL